MLFDKKKYYQKNRIIFGYTIAPFLITLVLWIISLDFPSQTILWLILLIFEFFFGIGLYKIILEKKEAKNFYGLGVFMSAFVALSFTHNSYLELSSLKLQNETLIVISFFVILIFEWVLSYIALKRGFLINLDLNKSKGVIDVENGTWNLQKQVISSRMDADEKLIDRWYSIGKIMMYFAPAIGTAVARSLPLDQNVVINSAIVSMIAIFFVSGSARSAALARNIAEIEKEVNKAIKIKTLE